MGVNTDGSFATKEELNGAIAELKKEQDEVLRGHESSIQELETTLVKSIESVSNLSEKVEQTKDKVLEQTQSLEDVQVSMGVRGAWL